MTLIYLDTETTGLDPVRHQIWEVAYAIGEGPILSSTVTHTLVGADPVALKINGYEARVSQRLLQLPAIRALSFEADLLKALDAATVVGSNPAFDTSFLRARWNEAPWKHRLLDIATYAMPAFGLDEPKGLAWIAAQLSIQAPDHTAAGDVHTLRECHRALQAHYAQVGAAA